MAWVKLNKNTIVNLDNVCNISIINAENSGCIKIYFTAGKQMSNFMPKEICFDKLELIQSKLFTNELIDISDETIQFRRIFKES